MAITSIILHYFNFENFPGKSECDSKRALRVLMMVNSFSTIATTGLGEHLNLFLKDTGIEMKYIRHTHAEWPAIKEDLVNNKKVLHPTMPFVEVNGKYFNKTAPTMRYLSKQLGKYEGANDEENYQLDAVSDIVRDHFGSLYPLFFSKDDEKLREHFEKDTKKYLAAYENIFAQKGGPYILGENVSFETWTSEVS